MYSLCNDLEPASAYTKNVSARPQIFDKPKWLRRIDVLNV